ncbi:3510_t:CDS:2, partial [Racocetra persica]
DNCDCDSFNARISALEQVFNDAQNGIVTNKLVVNEIVIDRWKISYESNAAALICRDTEADGDKRYAMFNDKHIDL